ncbi:MAG: ABC transporter ATP-binding protein [Actinobacteria bacterium]|nr:ABC transporter ATP-binding protein [Actinomycetota bacterium]
MTLVATDLRIALHGRELVAIDELRVDPGEILALVGESGSGKSLTARTLLGLSHQQGATISGRIELDGRCLDPADERDWRDVRGREIAMILQNPHASLNPSFRVGRVFELALRNRGASRAEARERARQAMGEVALPAALLERYPHQMSGGQAQRTAIAMALALGCRFLLGDEPTSALDAIVAAEVLRLLCELRDRQGLGVLLITHDVAVAGLADRVAVMCGGRIVEAGPSRQVLLAPAHEYTRQLIAALPAAERSVSGRA